MSRRDHKLADYEISTPDGRSWVRFSRWDADMLKTELHDKEPDLAVTIKRVKS